MHVLTKVLVVFAAILSVFLAALTIAYSSNADRITAGISAAQASERAALASRSQDAAMYGEDRVVKEKKVEQLNRDLSSKEGAIRQLQEANSRLESEKGKADAARQAVEGRIAELGELAKTQAALITSYREEVTQLRKNELDYRSQMLALESRLSDLETQREVLQNNVRALQEQLAETKVAQEKSASGSTGRSNVPFVPTALVVAKVDQVSKETGTGATLAKINVGTNDNIRENMKLMVIRDGTFIGNIVIVQADMKWSVGRVDTLGQADSRGKPYEVRAGDEIRSRAQ